MLTLREGLPIAGSALLRALGVGLALGTVLGVTYVPDPLCGLEERPRWLDV